VESVLQLGRYCRPLRTSLYERTKGGWVVAPGYITQKSSLTHVQILQAKSCDKTQSKTKFHYMQRSSAT